MFHTPPSLFEDLTILYQFTGKMPSLQDLPVELRLQIWEQYALDSDLTFHYPRRIGRDIPHQRYPLAILQTCQTYRHEALAILSFERFQLHCNSTERLLDLFSSLTPMQMFSLRHLTVRDIPFECDGNEYHWHDFFPLFPGIRLDTLTVLEGNHHLYSHQVLSMASTRYQHIAQQAQSGLGWKQLRYITSGMLSSISNGAVPAPSVRTRTLQPADCPWATVLAQRDHSLQGAGVEIFIAKEQFGGQKNAVLDPEKCEVLNHRTPSMAEMSRETMTVLKRGELAYFVEDGSELKTSVLELFQDRSWEMVKEHALNLRCKRQSEQATLAEENLREHRARKARFSKE